MSRILIHTSCFNCTVAESQSFLYSGVREGPKTHILLDYMQQPAQVILGSKGKILSFLIRSFVRNDEYLTFQQESTEELTFVERAGSVVCLICNDKM